MEDKKKYTSQDLFDFLLTLGGSLVGGLLTFIVFARFHLPPPILLMILGAWAAAGIGGYRVFNRKTKELQQEIDELKQLQTGNLPAKHQIAGSTFQRDLPANFAHSLPEAVSLEVRILDFMAMKKGRITILEAVVYLREPIDKVKPVLDKLQSDGFIRVDMSDAGEMMYVTDAFVSNS